MIGNEIANKATEISRTSPQNTSGTVESETENIGFDREIPKERYISTEKRHRNTNKLRLM